MGKPVDTELTRSARRELESVMLRKDPVIAKLYRAEAISRGVIPTDGSKIAVTVELIGSAIHLYSRHFGESATIKTINRALRTAIVTITGRPFENELFP